MEKKRLPKLTGFFFLAMLICTLISRAASSITVAQITAASPVNGMITHKVTAEGKIQANRELPVFTEAGQRVERIMVHEGEKVKAGDILFQLDMERLQEQIQESRQELSKLQLELEAAVQNAELAQEKKELARQRAQEDYERISEEKDQDIAWAEAELVKARERLEEYYNYQDGGEASEGGQSEDALADSVDAAQKTYDQALTVSEESLTAAKRAIEDAMMPEPADNTQEIKQGEIAQTEEKMEKLERLADKNGEVASPEEGIVTGLQISAGQITGQDAAVLLADLSEGCRFVAQVDKSQGEYLQKNMEVTLENPDTREKEGGLAISSLGENAENGELLDVTVSLSGCTLEIGTSARMTAEKRSSAYAFCIPVQALGENNSGTFVYVLEEQENVLGRELSVREVKVEVEDKNDMYAALKEGSLSEGQQVVVSSDRSIAGGSRVRLKES